MKNYLLFIWSVEMWMDLQKAFNRTLYYNLYNKPFKEPLDVDKWKSTWIT